MAILAVVQYTCCIWRSNGPMAFASASATTLCPQLSLLWRIERFDSDHSLGKRSGWNSTLYTLEPDSWNESQKKMLTAHYYSVNRTFQIPDLSFRVCGSAFVSCCQIIQIFPVVQRMKSGFLCGNSPHCTGMISTKAYVYGRTLSRSSRSKPSVRRAKAMADFRSFKCYWASGKW